MTDTSCVFCRIAEGRAPAHVVWSDAGHLAFLDTRPVATGHVLLIPREHVPWVDELEPDAHARLFAVVRELARPVAAAAAAPHTGVVVEGFGVPHAHVHLVPIRRGGDLDPCRQAAAAEADLRAAAERIRAAIAMAAG